MVSTVIGMDAGMAARLAGRLREHYSFTMHEDLEAMLTRGYGEIMGHKSISDSPPTSPTFVIYPPDPPHTRVRLFRCSGYWSARVAAKGINEFQRGHVVDLPDGDQIMELSGKKLFYFCWDEGRQSVWLIMLNDVEEIDIPTLAETGEMKFQQEFHLDLELGSELTAAQFEAFNLAGWTDREWYHTEGGIAIRWFALSYELAMTEVLALLPDEVSSSILGAKPAD